MARKQGSHSDITGPRVRDAALRLIARDGFAAVSMRQIARDVGVQAGALYNYTTDKQSLLYDLLHRHMSELLVAAEALPKQAPALERLDAFTRFHIGWHMPRREAVFISYMELRNLTPANFARIEALRHRYEDMLGDILDAGAAEGVLRFQDKRVTVMALIALLTGVTNWYSPAGRLDQGQIETLYVELVRRSAGAAPALIAAQ